MHLLTQPQLTSTLLSLLCCFARDANPASLHAALHCAWQGRSTAHSDVNMRAYSLLASLQQHRSDSALAQLVDAVLTGSASASLLWRIASVCNAVLRVLGAAAQGSFHGGRGRGVLAVDDARALLGRLLPNRTAEHLEQLCAAASSSPGGFACCKAVQPPRDHLELACAAGTSPDYSQRSEEPVASAAEEPAPRSRSASARSSAGGAPETGSSCDVERMPRAAPHGPDDAPPEKVLAEPRSDSDDVVSAAVGIPVADGQRTTQGHAKHALEGEFVVLVAEQHAKAVLELHAAATAALMELNASSDASVVPASALVETLGSVPGMHAECAAACVCSLEAATAARTEYSPSEHSAVVPLDVLAGTVCSGLPVQSAGDCDEAAAMTWLQGLQARSQGHASAAGLPDVA